MGGALGSRDCGGEDNRRSMSLYACDRLGILYSLCVANPAITSRPAFDLDAEIALIRAELLSQHDYLRIRRASRGLSRASRAQLLDAYNWAERAIRVNGIHHSPNNRSSRYARIAAA